MQPAGRPAGSPTFVARQPILDASSRVFAYELLFRGDRGDDRCGERGDVATASVITNAVVGIGLDTLTHGRRAFLNLSRRMLVEGFSEVLPPDRVVLELTEDIDADAEVLEACHALRRRGYRLALDDFELHDRNAALLPLADYVKIDFLHTSDAEVRGRILRHCHRHRPKLIAEKVESQDVFDVARREGHEYFQGYFFGRPVIRPGEPLPANHLGYLRLLQALQDRNLSAEQLERLVKPDPQLCYMILRTVNSAGTALRRTVSSIREGLVLLGFDAVRRWATLWVLASLGRHGHPELVSMSATRARCCEQLGAAGGSGAGESAFILGMCSLLDAILARPMPEILEHLPIADDARGALLGEQNGHRLLLDCAIAYERGDWQNAVDLAERAHIDPARLSAAHADALRWAGELHRLSV